MFANLHPAYSLHLEWALTWCGLHEPEFTEDGEITARLLVQLDPDRLGPRFIASRSEKQVEAVAQALVLADIASGATFGEDIVAADDRLRNATCVEIDRNVLFPTHRELLSYVQLSADHVARRLDTQLRGQKWEW